MIKWKATLKMFSCKFPRQFGDFDISWRQPIISRVSREVTLLRGHVEVNGLPK